MKNIQVWLDQNDVDDRRRIEYRNKLRHKYGTHTNAYRAMLDHFEAHDNSGDNVLKRIEKSVKALEAKLDELVTEFNTLTNGFDTGGSTPREAVDIQQDEVEEDFSSWGI